MVQSSRPSQVTSHPTPYIQRKRRSIVRPSFPSSASLCMPGTSGLRLSHQPSETSRTPRTRSSRKSAAISRRLTPRKSSGCGAAWAGRAQSIPSRVCGKYPAMRPGRATRSKTLGPRSPNSWTRAIGTAPSCARTMPSNSPASQRLSMLRWTRYRIVSGCAAGRRLISFRISGVGAANPEQPAPTRSTIRALRPKAALGLSAWVVGILTGSSGTCGNPRGGPSRSTSRPACRACPRPSRRHRPRPLPRRAS